MGDYFLLIFTVFLAALRLRARTWGRPWKRLLTVSLALAVTGLCVTHFVFRCYVITAASMAPTLNRFAIVVANLLPYSPQRGDVIVFRWQGLTVVKRVAGLPGDEVELRAGQVFVGDQPCGQGKGPDGTRRIPPGYLFVLGDNRDVSLDSRGFGDIPLRSVEGRVEFSLWPPRRISSQWPR